MQKTPESSNSVSHEIAKARECEGWMCLTNPACRLCEHQHKKCNSGILVLNVFIVSHLIDTFHGQQNVSDTSSPGLNAFCVVQNAPVPPSFSLGSHAGLVLKAAQLCPMQLSDWHHVRVE